MGLIEFSKLPVNTLVGANRKAFAGITKGRKIEKGYKSKYILTKSVAMILSSLSVFENRKYRKLLENTDMNMEPVFILGHWRSGTTFVHNILALDKHFGYTTTYQTVFPNLMLFGQPFFKKTMAWLMPDKRPTDNMELGVDLPQEEEFALSNMMPYTYYNFWFFPQNMMEYCDKFLTFKTATETEKKSFMDAFIKMIKISLWNTKGSQFLSKNPPHTGRIKEILEVFPNAKFIYLMRNPYTVFESTRSFFSNTIKPLQLQNISEDELESNILECYNRLYEKYESDKHLIPNGNLIEIKFEDFEHDAYNKTKEIYEKLGIRGFEEAEASIKAYLDQKKGYKKNAYKYNPRTIELVEKHWSKAISDWNYSLQSEANQA